MRIAWVTRSFLDYRVPVYREVDRMTGGDLHLFFSRDYVPTSVGDKALAALGERGHGLTGEFKLGSEDQHHMANRNFSLRWQPGLQREIAAVSPDVIVCDGFFKWTLPGLIYSLRRKVPLVIAYERTHHTERNAQRSRTLYRRAVVRATDAMACSGSLCRDYSVEVLGMDAGRITLGHMSADTEGLEAAVADTTAAQVEALRAAHGLTGLVYLYVGRLDERKGISELLAAWRMANFAPGEASLLLVGDGPLRAALEKEAQALPTVTFAGRVPYDALAPYYALADAFVIATLEDNWSLVVPEAMACGLPILSSVYNCCWPELVRPENGWTFTPEDTAQTAARLREAQAMGKAGLALMGEKSQSLIARHGPAAAARSIVDACEMAIAHRKED